jgi:glycine/D-amino acid oxidase-like deaminating enzyme
VIERQSATGYWIEEAGPVEPMPAAEGDLSADVVVVGGGYTGMWTALAIKREEPDRTVVLLDAGICGEVASGRNGGILSPMWERIPDLEARFGAERALAIGEASAEAVSEVGRWCEEAGVDAWYEPHPVLYLSSAVSQDDRWKAATDACARLGLGERYRPADEEEIGRHCRSPAFRRGAVMRPAATVQPARLGRGLRSRLREAGVEVLERSRVRRIEHRGDGSVVARTGSATVRARHAVVAVNAALAGWHGFRTRLSVTSSHMVVTEPVPDVIEAHGWTGAPISDYKTLLHYLRPTRDHRIAIGWGGGPMGYGGRRGRSLEIDAASARAAVAGLLRFFPDLKGRRIAHGWGGPIDVSPIHLPLVAADDRLSYAYGFTGNGVAPSNLVGRILADVALDRRTDLTNLALVNPAGVPRFPPEPFRYLGASLVRRAMIRRDDAEIAGRRAGWVTRKVADLPRRMHMSLPR